MLGRRRVPAATQPHWLKTTHLPPDGREVYNELTPSKYCALIGGVDLGVHEYTNNAQGIYFRLDLCPF